MNKIVDEDDCVEVPEHASSDGRDQSRRRSDSDGSLTATNEVKDAAIDALKMSKVIAISESTNSGDSVSRDEDYDDNFARNNAETDTKNSDGNSNENCNNSDNNVNNNVDNNVKSSGSKKRDSKEKNKKSDQQTKRPRTGNSR